jgi:hypothetical protein
MYAHSSSQSVFMSCFAGPQPATRAVPASSRVSQIPTKHRMMLRCGSRSGPRIRRPVATATTEHEARRLQLRRQLRGGLARQDVAVGHFATYAPPRLPDASGSCRAFACRPGATTGRSLARNVVHRDLHVGNVLLGRGYGRHVVKVTDFGISKLLDE